MRREPAQKKMILVGSVIVVVLMLSAGVPLALFHKSPDPVYYLGITTVYIAAALGVAGLLSLTTRLIRRIAGSKGCRDRVGSTYHASVKLSVRFWSERANGQASIA